MFTDIIVFLTIYFRLFFILHNYERVMWGIDIVIYAGIAFASTVQIEPCDLSCIQIVVFDFHAETLELLNICYLVTGRKEFNKPTVNEATRHILPSIWEFSLEIKVIPELEISISFKSLGELL